MKPCPAFPSIDITSIAMTSGYPLHDKDHFLEFATGMWLHTRGIVGPPTALEVHLTLTGFSEERCDRVVAWLRSHGQLTVRETLIGHILAAPCGRPVNWAERLVA